MEKAKYLLKIENKSVTEVSLEVGYSSLSKFANAFRKKYGVNPGFFKTQKNITNPKFPPGLKKIPEGLEFS
jgi:AraC-like DNA-binding protein